MASVLPNQLRLLACQNDALEGVTVAVAVPNPQGRVAPDLLDPWLSELTRDSPTAHWAATRGVHTSARFLEGDLVVVSHAPYAQREALLWREASRMDVHSEFAPPLRSLHQWLMAPNRAAVCVVSARPPAELFASARRWFEPLRARATQEPPRASEGTAVRENTGWQRVGQDPERWQRSLAVGRARTPDRYAEELLLWTLVHGRNSLVRAQLVRASMSADSLDLDARITTDFSGDSQLQISVGWSIPSRTQRAAPWTVVESLLQRVATEGVTGADLERAREAALRRWSEEREDNAQWAALAARFERNWHNGEQFLLEDDRYESVVLRDLQRVAQGWVSRPAGTGATP